MRGVRRRACARPSLKRSNSPRRSSSSVPALTGRLRSIASDIDGAVATADQRLKAVLGELRSAGFAARGSVGDEDPLLAIEDTLREFTPTKILIVTSDSSHENWRERHIRQRVAALGLPVKFVQAP
jgi:hypothetical protein